MDIIDVRKALWDLYANNEGWEGKSSEAYCDLQFPAYWDCENESQFCEPNGIMIYSYAFGPSRVHYIMRGKRDKEINYYTWESPDIYKKAIEVIESWDKNFKEHTES